MGKFVKFLLLTWFLIAIDPKSLYVAAAPERLPPFLGKFDNHLDCNTMANLLHLSRPDWLIVCAYTMQDFKLSPSVPAEVK